MYCNHCGKASPDDARLCAYCGAALAGGVSGLRLGRVRGAGAVLRMERHHDSDPVAIADPICRNRWAAVPHSVDRHAQ